MPDIDKNYYLDREGIDTLATEVKSKIADAAKTVKQSATTTNADYEVLFSQTADNTTRIEETGKNSNLKFNPSTGNLQATQLNGVTIGSNPKFTDNDTTYTFANGTNGFTVTPSGGTAQTVTVTPSIANNITGSGTSGYLTKFNGANTVTNGPALGSDTTKYLRNDGSWQVPVGTTYSADMGLTLVNNSFSVGQRWTAVTKGQTWSRLYLATPGIATVGSSGFLNITATRSSMVTNATFYITTSHNGYAYSTCQCISSCNYTQVRTRIVVNASGFYYFEIYDDKASIASGTTQTWNCCFVPFASTTLTPYTTFTDGTTVPDGYAVTNDFTTTGGNSAIAIKDISRSGTTFTATRLNGSTFTFDQQDNDTKNTAGSTDTSSKIYLIGATSQAANPQTYSDDQVYATNGTLTANNVVASANLGVSQTAGTSGGISLYGGAGNVTNYGIAMRTTANSGKHGYVQGDWGGYFYFAGATTRGLVYRHASANVASISGDGNAVFNGSVTVGGNATNTSGARMEYNSTTQSIDFVFV